MGDASLGLGSLGAYFDALEAAGFVVEALREPVAVRDDGSSSVDFLHLRGRLSGRWDR